tara:strand:- start:136 stop:696 length:561 start_codon:yes stop_codon:yes gene_type:complete
MKRYFNTLLMACTLCFSSLSLATIIALPVDGTVSDSVVGDSGWTNEDTFGDALDFISFDVSADSLLSVTSSSLINLGLSVYQGTIVNDFGIPFANGGDFTDLFSDLRYVTGNNPFVPGIGGSLTNVLLTAGSYTLAVGGNEGFFDTFTDYAYRVNVSLDEVPVPAPSTLVIMMLGLVGAVAMRKRA